MKLCVSIKLISITVASVMIVGGALEPSLSASRSQTAAPHVSAAFQTEVSQLAAGGLKLKEAVEASLDGSARHLAAIFQRDKAKAPNEAFEFRIIESDERTSRTIFRRADFFFSFDLAGESNKLNATDINGDGLKEIVVQSSSGGNCCSCNPTEIYQIRNHKVELIGAGPIQKIIDLNGDGTSELLVTDVRWESYDDLSHAASPGALMVYAWRNGKYVYAARDFTAFYKAELERMHASIEEAKSQITADDYSDESYVGLATGLAITCAHMGQLDQGLKEMETLLNKERHLQHVELLKHQNKISAQKSDELKDLERKLKSLIIEWRKSENKEEVIKVINGLLFKQKEKFVVAKQQKKMDEKFEETGKDISEGDKVKMKKSRQVGIVKEIRGKKAIIQVGFMPINVDLAELVAVKEKV